ncbi:hypothetical protein [Halosimplex amylolyticum]|uniref:hypothetical protein n=1 Tax=Halosimplex amylolyticum TaxID=3396616 RepID=UPI003F54D0CD
MSQSSHTDGIGSRFSVADRNRLSKVAALALCLQIVGLALIYYHRYPLSFPATGILQAQGYWALVVVSVFTTTAFAYFTNAPLWSFASALLFYVMLYSNNLLFYSIPSGDTSGEIVDLTLLSRFTTLSAARAEGFGYLSYPLNHIFALLLNRVYDIGGIIPTMDLGYAIYTLTLVIAVWLFAFRLGDSFSAYIASVAYLILAKPVLNNQFVPQFLALISLFFLFNVVEKRGLQWRAVELALFVALVFSHPVFPVLYPLALLFRPVVSSLIRSYATDESFSTAADVFRHPLVLARRTLSLETWTSHGSSTYVRAVVFFSIYFVQNPPRSVVDLVSSPGEAAGSPIVSLLSPFLPISTESAPSGGGPEEALLYDLVPRSLDLFVNQGSKFVLLALFGLLSVSFLLSHIGDPLDEHRTGVLDYQVEIIFACFVFFLYSTMISSMYGTRVLQVAFLPTAVFFVGAVKFKRVFVVLIVVLALCSPVLTANFYVNNALTAGGDSIGYHETQAGELVGDQYPRHDVVVPPHTPYPVGPMNQSRQMDIRYFVFNSEARVPDSGPVIYSTRLTEYLRYLGYDCQLSTANRSVVYDNGAEVIWRPDGGSMLECLRATENEPQ